MGVAKSTLLAAGLALFTVACADPSSGGQGESAKDVLFTAMEKARWLSFEGIVVRKSSSKDRGTMQVKISQRAGVSKTSVLSPLPIQGVTTVDDGRNWSTYIPDENRVISQESPRRSLSGRAKRAADQNYRFTSEGVTNIAGRKAFAIVAMPKAAEMPSRRYWIDTEYPLMLRMEVLINDKPFLLMDTKAISFITVSEESLRLQPAADVRKIWMTAPEKFRNAAEAIDRVGFKPSMPQLLPFGFIVHEPQIVGDKNDKFVALRLSDGLASATLYQWNSRNPNPVPCSDKATVREANGVKMRLVGDLPEAVLARLLETFVREALKGLMPLLGTTVASDALVCVQRGRDGDEGACWFVFFDL